MESQGIIRKINEHTDWCSSLTYVVKKNGKLRMCFDPRKLNSALKRCPSRIPTVEETTPSFVGSVYFTKFDAKAEYCSVQLEEDFQAVTTFRTPLGRYCFCRLPFGLCVSQDIFQRKMDDIISQCEGCVGISDDIVIHGFTEEEHDRRVIEFLNVARKEGLKLNPEKCVFKSKEVTFFGRLYADRGVFPGREKCNEQCNSLSDSNVTFTLIKIKSYTNRITLFK